MTIKGLLHPLTKDELIDLIIAYNQYVERSANEHKEFYHPKPLIEFARVDYPLLNSKKTP